MTPDWMTTEQLAAEMGRPVRWVQEKFKTGEIPSVKIGNRRWFTAECRAELMARHLGTVEPDVPADLPPAPEPVVDAFGRVSGRGRRAS